MTARRPRNWPAIVGLALGLIGVIGYFLVVFRLGAVLPRVRNGAAPDWMLIAAGLGLSALGVAHGGRGAAVLAAVNVVLACAFGWLLYGMPAVPATAGPTVGAPAPDFALVDQDGRLRRLADFRGAPLLLVFYRGHW